MKKWFSVAYLLIGLAAIAQGMMWVNLFSLIHTGIASYIGGIPAGFAIVGILVRSATMLPRVQSKRARNGGWALLVAVLLVEPVVLGVVNWWFMPAELQGWFISYIMAGGASLTISLILVLGALVDRSLVAAEKPAIKAEKPAKPVVQTEPEPEKPAYVCSSCDPARSFGSQSALNAHQRSHKPIKIDPSLLIKKDGTK